jgi:hypothetical protein
MAFGVETPRPRVTRPGATSSRVAAADASTAGDRE